MTPEPNSPEAHAKAQKIKNVFFLIAAANIVLIAVVLFLQPAPEKAGDPASPEKAASVEKKAEWTAEQLAPFEAVLDASLKAYAEKDAAAFYANFAPERVPPDSAAVFKRLFVELCHREFGPVTARKLLPKETNPDPDFGMLVFEATGATGAKMKLGANFVRVDGQLRLAQVRMERLER